MSRIGGGDSLGGYFVLKFRSANEISIFLQRENFICNLYG